MSQGKKRRWPRAGVGDAELRRNIRAIRRGLKAVKKGETIPVEEVFAEVQNVLGRGTP